MLEPVTFKAIVYRDLNARQKENYNFLKLSAVLADFGFITLRLSDDWQGADFIAQHIDGKLFLRVQLKGRLTFQKKYLDKKLHVAFYDDLNDEWYLYPHDELLQQTLTEDEMGSSESWMIKGNYSYPWLSQEMRTRLAPYKIPKKIADKPLPTEASDEE